MARSEKTPAEAGNMLRSDVVPRLGREQLTRLLLVAREDAIVLRHPPRDPHRNPPPHREVFGDILTQLDDRSGLAPLFSLHAIETTEGLARRRGRDSIEGGSAVRFRRDHRIDVHHDDGLLVDCKMLRNVVGEGELEARVVVG
ncbi:hypothetical protein CMUS01_05071 [Colletotrichum musicola]|uniref:Uncharacterized protein n=1 Tax=Colletotrichum musicola TaxID=2175873 RepID=A0A8H6NLW5_9PEZI|nr:hypothetical protein CMUS01_05071 [Colletotrichum musicola]